MYSHTSYMYTGPFFASLGQGTFCHNQNSFCMSLQNPVVLFLFFFKGGESLKLHKSPKRQNSQRGLGGIKNKNTPMCNT